MWKVLSLEKECEIVGLLQYHLFKLKDHIYLFQSDGCVYDFPPFFEMFLLLPSF